MSATHRCAGVPLGLSGRRLSRLLCVVLGVAAFALGLHAASPAAGDYGLTKHVATDLERVTGVEFWTPDQSVTYTVRIYSELSGDQPGELLFEQTGTAPSHGYYSVPVTTDLTLYRGQSVVATVRFDSSDRSGAVAPTEDTRVGVLSSPVGVPEAVTITQFIVTAPPVIAGNPMTFTVSAAGTANGDVLTYQIDMGDGTPVAAAAPLCTVSPVAGCVTAPFTYAKAGTYTAKLTVTDTTDVTLPTLTKTLTVTVLIPVSVTASPTCGLAPLNVCFTGSASNGTPPYHYSWNFADGTAASTEQNPCHAFLSAGIRKVVLTVTDAIGATGSADVTISVIVPLTVTMTPSGPVDGIPVTLVNFCASASGGLPPYDYTWSFGDGTSATAVTCPQHAYATVGIYNASVTVTDQCNQTVTVTRVITVHKAPWIRITSPAAGSLQHAQVTLTSVVTVETGVTVTRVEYYVNGLYLGSSSVAPYSVTWDARGVNGTFTLTAIAYDSMGRSNSTEISVTITIANPTVDGRVQALSSPFRLRVFGNYFQKGSKIYINDMPVPATVKSTTMAVAKQGSSLKAMIPKGVPVIVSVVNPDGGISLSSTYVR